MFGRRSQRDFEDEIRSHLELEAERLRGQGLSPLDAERAARRHFGNVSVAEDHFYHAQRFSAMQDSGRDLRHAWRTLRRTPGFLITSVVTLGLAIGAVTGMFNVVNTVILKSLPFPDAERLVAVQGTAPGSDLPAQFGLSSEFYLHYKERSKLVDDLFIFGGGMSTFRTDARAERVVMAWPSNDMYTTLGVRPQLGRLPVPEDQDDAVLISDQMWSTWFGRDPSVIGKSYFVSDSIKQIIGVMPPGFVFPDDNIMLWVSTPVRLEDVRVGEFGTPMIARLKPGVTRDQLAAELTRLAKELPARFGGSPAYARTIDQYRARVVPVLDGMIGPTTRTSLWVLLGAVAVVLLIACANVGNLFMVRAEGRTRDLAIRRAIGASRAQLVRLQMAEALVVALAAGALAIVLSRVTLPLFINAAPRLPRLAGVRLDLPTIAAAFGLVVLTALACGTVPALRASAPDLSRLREGGRGNTGRRRRGRDVLVAAQTALALVLLIGAALLVQSFKKLRHVDPGYTTQDIYTFQYAPERPFRDGPSWGALHLDMMERLRALPGVTAVGVVNNIPLDEGTSGLRVRTDDMPADGNGALVNLNITGGDYFSVMGIKLLSGRAFTRSEAVTPNNSVILSRSAAEKLWPGQNALGRTVRPRIGNTDSLRFTVVGIVADVKQNDWRQEGDANIYVPLTGPAARSWSITSPAYVVKSSRAEKLQPEVRAVIRQVAPEAPVYREFTMAFLARRSMQQLSFTMLTLGVVAGLALLLGAIGLYGVLSYVVAERTREIGLRMALGATAQAVRRMVVTQGTRVVVFGVVIGVAVALASTRLLESLLFGVKPVDPIVFGGMSLMMIAIGMLASYVPARRASSVNPIESLRSD